MNEIETKRYKLYNHQLEMWKWDDGARFEVFMGPARSGKGVLGAIKVCTRTVNFLPIWSARNQQTFHPRWVVWCIAPTYLLAEQQWLDVQAYLPKELMAAEPVKTPTMRISLIHDGLIEFKSADKPEMLVSKPVDYIWITEAREIKANVWSFLRQRLMSPERVEHSAAFIEGTAGEINDPDDPFKLHWFWSLVLSGRGQNRMPEYRSFYWYEDKARFKNLDHPLLSLTPEGRKEIESMRNDPNMSVREFEMGVLGKVQTGRQGRPVIKGFIPEIHIDPNLDYNHRNKLYRCWDFGRQYPACTFHQINDDGSWDALAEHCPILQDVLDVEFGQQVIDLTEKLFGIIPQGKIYDYGDFESTHKEDSRRSTTQQTFKQMGIDLIVTPTKPGDEEMAIEIMNGRMKIGNDRKPHFRIHPRCELSIKGFQGDWIFETGKSGDIEWIKNNVCEIHPHIDVFDTFKYLIKHVLKLKVLEYYAASGAPKKRLETIYDENGMAIGQEMR